MKFVGVREAQAKLSGLVTESQKQRIVLTRHGRPIAVLMGIADLDLEELLLTEDIGFARAIAKQRARGGPHVSHETLVAEMKRPIRRKRVATHRTKKGRR